MIPAIVVLTTTIAGFASKDAKIKFLASGQQLAETSIPFTPRRRNQRVADDESRHGRITAPNLGGQAATRWLQAVRRAVADGACRAEAEAAAWAAVGRRPPALIDGPDVLGGLTGAERARAVLARLAAGREGADTSNRHGEGSGAAQNMPDAPREGWADSGPATGRTANRPVGRVIV